MTEIKEAGAVQRALEKVLVVDDDDQILKQITWALSDEYAVFTANDRKSALEVFRRESIPVVLLDLGLPPHPRSATEGLHALDDLLTENPLAKVIIVSGNSERQNAIKAVDRGAHDIFPKPVDVDELKVVLSRAYKRAQLESESLHARSRESEAPIEGILGSCAPMQAVYGAVRKVAAADIPVLILGESGTGKELIAQAIHRQSRRREKPFVAINCGAIPENLLESELFGFEKGAFTGANSLKRGRVEHAQGGTLFLDEIGELAQPLQVKMLRFLQAKAIERVGGRETIPVDCRIVAATNRDLEKSVREGGFREDLYFRLAVVTCTLPPLRDRGDDVLSIAEHFIAAYSKELRQVEKRLTRGAIDAIRRHSWPGNVRELENRVKRAVVLADGPAIDVADLELTEAATRALPVTGGLKGARNDLEREIVARALAENKGNISRTARVLGISRPTLYELIAKYGL